MPLPVAIQRSAGVVLQEIDYPVQDAQAKADATGTATVTYGQVDPTEIWRVERIVVQHNSTKQLAVTVYVGAGTPSTIQGRDWTPLPPGVVGVAEYPRYLTVPGGAGLTVQATGANAGDVITVSTQYALVQRVPGGS